MSYKPRILETLVRRLVKEYPVVTITGPRQSGKTTFCRALFSRKPYVSLEPIDQREYARVDPRGFLAEYPEGVVIDEIQNAPDLTSYIQSIVDDDPEPGRYIVTGSQHFGLTQAVNQSLAGRTAIVHLLPLSLDEAAAFGVDVDDLWKVIFRGGYPGIYERKLDPRRWLSNYLRTYIERDVRQLSDIGNLEAFTRFVTLAAGRTAQEINFSSLGGDVGASHNTVRAWMSVLEASFLIFRLPAWHPNLRKQLVKSPKLHFVDSGLVCHLLGIRSADDLRHHPLRGAIFESWVAAEIYKHRLHRGEDIGMYHFRQSRGLEVDLIITDRQSLIACEVKSTATFDSSFLRPLKQFDILLERMTRRPQVNKRVVFGGDKGQKRSDADCLSWQALHKQRWLL